MTCACCGAGLPAGAMFCGECGHGVGAVPSAPQFERKPAREDDAALGAHDPQLVATDSAGAPDSGFDAPGPTLAGHTPGSAADPALAQSEAAPLPSVAPATVVSPPEPRHVAALQPEATPAASATGPDPVVVAEPARERFVLQFSTGEAVQVSASGLIGRNPRPEPGEVFDELVAIVDPGRSVSRTHLEFGQEEGWFWVCDRYSGNGTVLCEPGAEPRRCEPGRRYRVPRGSRVELGDQFMIVS